MNQGKYYGNVLIIILSFILMYGFAGADDITRAGNRFAFKLLTHILDGDENHNVFISPLSIYLALSMTCNGAANETRDAMTRALEIDPLKLNELNQFNKELLGRLQAANSLARLTIANSIWVEKSFAANKTFINTATMYYNSDIVPMSINEEAVERINQWVGDKTNSRIERIIYCLDPDEVMVLLNAIYFKGRWHYKFDARDTNDRDFYLLDRNTVKVPMMTQIGDFLYFGGETLQIIAMPYEGDDLYMYIILPNQDIAYHDFIMGLDADIVINMINQLSMAEGSITIPKIKLDYELLMNDILIEMGMKIAFESEADFSKMTTPEKRGLFIGSVRHKAFLEIDEEGTEAAAATAVVMKKSMSFSPPERTFDFVADHPYLFLIQDVATGSILFTGSITNPE